MAKAQTPEGSKSITINRRASFNYELGDRFEAGLVLLGSEVKTLRQGSADLTDGYAAIEKGEVVLRGAFFPRLKHAAFGHEERRPRKLLLHAAEVDRLRKELGRSGVTLVPVRLYWKGGRAKVEIAVATGKRSVDKRVAIKERELDREVRSAMTRARKG